MHSAHILCCAHRVRLLCLHHSLHGRLMWPNLEVTFFVSFSTGLLQCATAVLGATCAGYATTIRSLATSVITITLIIAAFAWQTYRLIIFLKYHDEVCWQPAEPPEAKDEIDDPFFAFLTTSTKGLVRPSSRELGGFEPPDEDMEEPARTERALARFFSWRPVDARRMRAGDSLSELPVWLGDSSGTARGIWYIFFTIMLQLTTATILGLTYSMQWPQTSNGGKALLGVLLFLQLATAW